ncbi:MAG TPA: hypothetical protein VFX97_14235 [Pyrinomonadaceae bacterium]|nr:hypothetical protein [Pyrinomonadaceae bacterium]
MQLSKKFRAVQDTLLTFLFTVAISLPMVGLVFRWDVMSEQLENRRLAKLPALPANSEAISNFPKEFTAYFNDNFGFRASLVRWQALAKLRLFKSASPNVIVGKDGWLFYAGEYTAHGQPTVPAYTKEQLDRWRQLLEGRRDWLARRGIRYLFVVCPNKESVYPEYLPSTFRRKNETRLDQLLAYLRKNSDLKILDLRPALHEAKTRRPVFYKVDSHWNSAGGFVGYQAIINELRKSFPDLQPVSESDLVLVNRQRAGNLVGMLGLGGHDKENSADLRVRKPAFSMLSNEPITVLAEPLYATVAERRGEDLPRLVMFGDSMNKFMIQFFPQNFSRAVFVAAPRLDPVLIASERADIVIQEMAEMRLVDDPPADLSEIDLLTSEGKGRVSFKFNTNYIDAEP